jgi:hypothetical protein
MDGDLSAEPQDLVKVMPEVEDCIKYKLVDG